MSRDRLLMVLMLILSLWIAQSARAQDAKPANPLTCHGVVCAMPTSSCQMLASATCEHGGGPPRCPAIVNVPDGSSCNDGNVCTSNDVCTAGVCGGTAIQCSSPTDICTSTGSCATPCGPAGCTVTAANGFLSPTLTIPAGALSTSVSITMVDQGGDASDSTVFHVYSFGPSGTTFTTPATVNLPAPPLTAGQDVVIEVSDNGSTWTAVPTTLANGRVSGPIAHFSFCRTRAFASTATNDTLKVTDIVDYQDLVQVKPGNGLTIPPAGEQGTCYSGDLYGVCVKIKNSSATQTIKSICPVPTPSPAPAGCIQLHVIPWQCYTASRNFPAPFDPATNASTYEGQHCDFSGLLIPCAEAIYNVDPFLPSGGLAPGQEVWADISFFQNATPVASGSPPYSCFGSSFIGLDVLFKEPQGADSTSGMRSAKDGVCIEVAQGTTIFIKSTPDTCNSGLAPGQYTCNQTSCRASWDSLVSGTANYPVRRCVRGTTPIDCSQFNAATDTVYQNWLNDARF